MKAVTGCLYRLYGWRKRRWRRGILWLVQQLEGGEMYSPTLRRIFQDYHKVKVGMYSYGCFRPEDIPEGTEIGNYCSFARGVAIFNAGHPWRRKSLHPFFYNPSLGVVREETISRGRLVIGHDVWIGRNALILPQVSRIGNGAVIGAGAVVTRDVPPYAVVAGNPARVIRYRFEAAVQAELESSRWWEQPIEVLRLRLEEFLCDLAGPVEAGAQGTAADDQERHGGIDRTH